MVSEKRVFVCKVSGLLVLELEVSGTRVVSRN